MKKTIINSITYDENKSISVNLKGNEDYSNFVRQYDNINKYIKNFSSDDFLEEFPEHFNSSNNLLNFTPFATNTGLMCFYNSNAKQLVVYDLIQEDNALLYDIQPDISMFENYNYINNPLNVRKINFEKNSFKAERYYKRKVNKEEVNYSFFNVDKIGNANLDVNNGYFQSLPTVQTVSYNFKPILYIRAFNSNGSEITNGLRLYVNNILMNNAIKDNKPTNIYWMDCSKRFNDYEDHHLTLSLSTELSGYLEVI